MYLGIDVGTSSVKLVLYDENHEVISHVSSALALSQPKALWSEQAPLDWWHAVLDCIQQLKKQNQTAFSAIKSIGLSGQQHGAVLMNQRHEVIRPAILWNDGRSFLECSQLKKMIPDYADITGNDIMPGFTAPKLLWVKHNEPNHFQQIAKIILPKDYIRFQLTGDYATDLSDASGTSWLDVKNRKWSQKILSACNLTENHMPTLFEGSEITSNIHPRIAEELGLHPSTLVVGGAGDNAASAINLNVYKPGQAFLSIGTSGVYFVATDSYQQNSEGGLHTFCHCLPNQWHHMSVHLSAGNSLQWFANIHQIQIADLLLEAEQVSDPAHTVLFLPYLSGERTPHNNPFAQGVFFGLTNKTTRADMTRAILEGVAFSFAEGQFAIQQTKLTIQELLMVGGGTKNIFWGKIIATILNQSLVVRSQSELGAALGAAKLAYLGAHQLPMEKAFSSSPTSHLIEPDLSLTQFYQDKFGRYQTLYHSTKHLTSEITL